MIKNRKNISDHIYEFIKNDILTDSLNFGDKIVEIDYSKKLNVSRTPLREAIKKLEIEGIIERLPNGRLRIMEMTETRIKEIFTIRLALEKILLENLIDSKNILLSIKSNLAQTEIALNNNDIISVKRLFDEFNQLFYSSPLLEFTTKILKSYDFIISKLRRSSLKSNERMMKAFLEHKKINEALLDNNLEEAILLNISHLNGSLNSILKGFSETNQ